MKKNERKFMERDNIQNRLMYLGPGGSLIEVDFDSKSEPYIRAIDFFSLLRGTTRRRRENTLGGSQEKVSQWISLQK